MLELIPKHKWIGLDAGNELKRIEPHTSEEVIILQNGMSFYQKFFYDKLFEPKNSNMFVIIEDATKVQCVLEAVNETTRN